MYSDKTPFDKFYTKPEVAKRCLDSLDFCLYDFIIEPSAGNGSFSDQIVVDNSVFMDIEPEGIGINRFDWLDYIIDDLYENVLIVGNPPFGKNNNLSKKFLRHAFSFGNVKTVAFILPNVYHKYTFQRVVPERYRISNIINLDTNSFFVGDKEFKIPTSFFVFDRSPGEDLRFDLSKYSKNGHFLFSDKEDYDFFVMGAAPNNLKEYPNQNNRGYYVKSIIDVDVLRDRFRSIKWTSYSSAGGGVAWRTKAEIIKCYGENYPDSMV